MGSWKLESGLDKGDVRERKKKKRREIQNVSKWGVVKLVGSGKLESGVEKGDVREKKKGDSKKKKKKLANVIFLTFEFVKFNRLLF